MKTILTILLCAIVATCSNSKFHYSHYQVLTFDSASMNYITAGYNAPGLIAVTDSSRVQFQGKELVVIGTDDSTILARDNKALAEPGSTLYRFCK